MGNPTGQLSKLSTTDLCKDPSQLDLVLLKLTQHLLGLNTEVQHFIKRNHRFDRLPLFQNLQFTSWVNLPEWVGPEPPLACSHFKPLMDYCMGGILRYDIC